jgi:hypothetical protein
MADDEHWHGHAHESLQKAIEDAWEDVKRNPGQDPPTTLRVTDIFFTGSNPISEYSVIVARGGH